MPPDTRLILVTGRAGFIGSHLVIRLLRDGLRVAVLDNLSTGSHASSPRTFSTSPASS